MDLVYLIEIFVIPQNQTYPNSDPRIVRYRLQSLGGNDRFRKARNRNLSDFLDIQPDSMN